MSWIYLILAGVFEMFGVGAINKLNKNRNISSLSLLITMFSGSFIFLYLAMKQLPMGISYAIWTGIGAAGGAILGMIVYDESKDWRRICCILLIIASVIGLKLTS